MARYQKAPDPLPAVKSIQTGYTNAPLVSAADTVEQMPYADITISAVDPNKATAEWMTLVQIRHIYNTGANVASAQVISARLLNSTTIRLTGRVPTASSGSNLEGRWRVVEYN